MWVNANLEKIRIKDMDLDYVIATMNWLLQRSATVKFMLELRYRKGGEIEALRTLESIDPYAWMKETPLFRRLLERFDTLSNQYAPGVAKPKIYDTDDEDLNALSYNG
jgi:hypothetical protein